MAEENESLEAPEPAERVTVREKSPLTLPFFLTLAALLFYFAFQTVQLLGERSNMAMVKSSQEAAIQEAQKVQAQFKSLVSKTSELADQGHAGAKMVMEELLQRGVSAPQAVPPASKAPGTPDMKPTK
jgi:hypothetical protein